MIPTKRTLFVVASTVITTSVLSLTGCNISLNAVPPEKTDTIVTTTETTPTEIAKYKVGDVVATQWTDGFLYPAKVTAVNGLKYNVDFDDGSKGTDYEESKLQLLPATLDLKVGDGVMASWTGTGKFYSGTVKEVKADGAIVKWDDGSDPSEVKFGKIFKK